MRLHEFYLQFYNTPIKDRFKVLDFNELGIMTLNTLYEEVSKIEDKIRPDKIRQQKLIDNAAKIFEGLK
jgi:hypothetical protein